MDEMESRIVEWMHKHKIDPVCPMCGQSKWKKGAGYRWGKLPGFGHVLTPSKQGNNMPRTYVICQVCAHVMVFPKLTMDL